MNHRYSDHDDFKPSLETFVLNAYAQGENVQGEWHLGHTDPMIPDMLVVIERVDDSGPKDSWSGAIRDDQFKTRLQRFLLDAFADGVDIEGRWELQYRVDDLPAWDVEIDLGDWGWSVDDDVTVECGME